MSCVQLEFIQTNKATGLVDVYRKLNCDLSTFLDTIFQVHRSFCMGDAAFVLVPHEPLIYAPVTVNLDASEFGRCVQIY